MTAKKNIFDDFSFREFTRQLISRLALFLDFKRGNLSSLLKLFLGLDLFVQVVFEKIAFKKIDRQTICECLERYKRNTFADELNSSLACFN